MSLLVCLCPQSLLLAFAFKPEQQGSWPAMGGRMWMVKNCWRRLTFLRLDWILHTGRPSASVRKVKNCILSSCCCCCCCCTSNTCCMLQVAAAAAAVFVVDEVGFGFGFIWFCWSAPNAAVCYFEILVEWLVCGEMHVATPPEPLFLHIFRPHPHTHMAIIQLFRLLSLSPLAIFLCSF